VQEEMLEVNKINEKKKKIGVKKIF